MGLPENWWLLALGTMLLGLAAVVGYRLGRHRRRRARQAPTHNRCEIERALSIINDLEGVARRLGKAAALHGKAARKFATRLVRYERLPSVSRTELCDRADEMLKPTARLTADISHAYAELQQQMSHLSTFVELRTDPLTGTANRLALDEKVSALLEEQTRFSAPLSLAMVDIDFFKQINEARCLLQGDRVLTKLAKVIAATIRQCDMLARFGGEEFVIVMPDAELCLAAEVAERIRGAVLTEMSITVSIGLAASANGDTPGTLFDRADAALVRAKSAGRNCVYLHEGTMGHIVGVKSRLAVKPASVSAKTRGAGDKTIADEIRRRPSSGQGSTDNGTQATPPGSESPRQVI